jgi:hypothetical protein
LSQRRRTGSAKAADATNPATGRERLARVADLLGFPIAALFEDRSRGKRRARGMAALSPLAESDMLRLAQAFARIEDRHLRRSIVALVKKIAARQGKLVARMERSEIRDR